ncbi:MAG TPA: XTP/dITP diphosphatase [Deltaproteobacteria bacterium]|jgi:XTP/dITP diphosphohydrolase|nr:XTP/dITP diphosphatase [Deltaproteobacteria bacterium]HOI05778.1 XTP/dITP diphosphatase [Deltaproteobacteria bacterium]
MKLLAATNNKGKIKEIVEILSDLGITVVTPRETGLSLDVEETGSTFEENALIKARAWCEASGMPTLADDSGLCVDALEGRPGILSARFAGEGASDGDNIALLLASLRGREERSARFVCVVALALPGGEVIHAEGRYEGIIIDEPRGTEGFGYDPVFYDPVMGKTLAQMSPAEKNARSHRRRALDALKEKLVKSGLLS